MNKKNITDNTITLNKKARHDFFIEESIECGIVLEGWEVKSLRAGRVQLRDSYAIVRHSELFIIGAIITPLVSASTHKTCDPTRTRKLLLNKKEISKLIGLVERKNYTLVPLKLYWARGRVKCELGTARGKKQHDKRESIKSREWEVEKGRIMKQIRRT